MKRLILFVMLCVMLASCATTVNPQFSYDGSGSLSRKTKMFNGTYYSVSEDGIYYDFQTGRAVFARLALFRHEVSGWTAVIFAGKPYFVTIGKEGYYVLDKNEEHKIPWTESNSRNLKRIGNVYGMIKLE